MKQTPKLFNPADLVIQVDDSVIIHPLAMRFVERYSKEGYKVAVNEFQFSPRYFSILDRFDYIKINFRSAFAFPSGKQVYTFIILPPFFI